MALQCTAPVSPGYAQQPGLELGASLSVYCTTLCRLDQMDGQFPLISLEERYLVIGQMEAGTGRSRGKSAGIFGTPPLWQLRVAIRGKGCKDGMGWDSKGGSKALAGQLRGFHHRPTHCTLRWHLSSLHCNVMLTSPARSRLHSC